CTNSITAAEKPGRGCSRRRINSATTGQAAAATVSKACLRYRQPAAKIRIRRIYPRISANSNQWRHAP
ncbi:MAG: hypothetical protein AABX60_03970, partial [Nanoarchaeota archaeon]